VGKVLSALDTFGGFLPTRFSSPTIRGGGKDGGVGGGGGDWDCRSPPRAPHAFGKSFNKLLSHSGAGGLGGEGGGGDGDGGGDGAGGNGGGDGDCCGHLRHSFAFLRHCCV